MALQNWDPLDTPLIPELLSATIKRQIKNILKSYTGWYDPLSEMIQNALDAVDHRKKKDQDYQPAIWITVDLKENQISVTDNGIGFSEDKFMHFLAPNVSFKTQGDRGNKGVGATYLAYGFNFLQLGTKTPDFSFVGTLRDGREWVEDAIGTKTRPKILESPVIHTPFNAIDQGSTFSLKLVGDYIHPKDLKYVGATTAEQWEIVLRIKTPLGGIYSATPPFLPKCYLAIIDEDGNASQKEIVACEYIYPHSVIPTCKSIKEIISKQQELLNKGKDASKFPDSFSKLNGLYNFWTTEDFISDKGDFSKFLDTPHRALAQKYNLTDP